MLFFLMLVRLVSHVRSGAGSRPNSSEPQRQRMSSEIGVQVSAGGAELLDPVSSRVYGQRPGGYTRRVGCYLGGA